MSWATTGYWSKTADVQAVAADGMSAGAAAGYVKSGDERVIAATAIIGGGESTSVEFSVAELTVGGDYTFFAHFPDIHLLCGASSSSKPSLTALGERVRSANAP